MKFEIIGPITDIEVIASGARIQVLRQLRKAYGRGRWRKLKGRATVRLRTGRIRTVELHWYEAHGIGKRDMKIKRYLNES